MEQSDRKQSLSREMFRRLSDLQFQLRDSIAEAIVGINSVNAVVRTAEINACEHKLGLLEERAVELDNVISTPLLLKEDEKTELLEDQEKLNKVLGEYAKMASEEPTRRQSRIFTILEHLERRISHKRSTVNFNRTIMISLAAIVVALVSIGIALLSS